MSDLHHRITATTATIRRHRSWLEQLPIELTNAIDELVEVAREFQAVSPAPTEATEASARIQTLCEELDAATRGYIATLARMRTDDAIEMACGYRPDRQVAR